MAKVKPEEPSVPFTQFIRWTNTDLGAAMYIKVRTQDDRALTWREVWEAIHSAWPDMWAVQIFPPAGDLVDEANVYHLFVIGNEPKGMNIIHRHEW